MSTSIAIAKYSIECVLNKLYNTLYTVHVHGSQPSTLRYAFVVHGSHRHPTTPPIEHAMKSSVALSFVVLALCCCCAGLVSAAAQKYEPKYDNVSIESVLSNDRVLTNYIKCLLDKGPCTKEGRELKRK